VDSSYLNSLLNSEITRITVNGNNAYELKRKFLDDLFSNAFSGTNGEDAIEHINNFLKIVDPIKLLNVNYEQIRLDIFPISLVGNASEWFNELKGSITSWVDLTENVFGEYYPPFRTSRITMTKSIRDSSNFMFEKWLASKFANHMIVDLFTKKVLWNFWIKSNDQEGVTDEGFSDAEEASNDDEQETTEIFKIETNLFDYETSLCTEFKEFNFLLKVDPELFTYDIERTKTYEDYENKLNDELEEAWSEDGVPYEICDHICEPFRFKNGKAKWPTCNSNEDGFSNGGELPGMVQMSLSLAENVIVAGTDNRLPMLTRTQYSSWASRMLLYIQGKENGKLLVNSVLNGPSNMERESKMYDEFDIFTSVPRETIHSYYLRFTQLTNDMHTIRKIMRLIQVNTKFINHLQPEWSKFVTDVKLAKDLQNTNFEYLYAYLREHKARADEGYASSGARSNATTSGVNRTGGTNTTGQAKVIRCYNCQEEGHIARQCTKPKRPRNSTWFKEKAMLAKVLESRVVLDEEKMEFLADNGDIVTTGLLQPLALSEAVRKSPKLGRAAQVQTSTQSDSVNLSSPIPISKAFLNVQKVTKAKLETMNSVCEIVKTQLAFPCGSVVAPNSKFSAIGVDSLDRTICGYVLSIHSYKYVLLGKHEMNEMLMYPKVDSSEITYVTLKKRGE
nr:retrovirus-related Pol polyprotein from transposon TNT 1-94 [Tanacetum cinerariifolium]